MRRIVPLLAAVATALAGEELPKGQIIDRVVCARDPAQSYALYIPSGYTPSKPAPVIFCFDPAARGRVPVEQFQPARRSAPATSLPAPTIPVTAPGKAVSKRRAP